MHIVKFVDKIKATQPYHVACFPCRYAKTPPVIQRIVLSARAEYLIDEGGRCANRRRGRQWEHLIGANVVEASVGKNVERAFFFELNSLPLEGLRPVPSDTVTVTEPDVCVFVGLKGDFSDPWPGLLSTTKFTGGGALSP